MEEDGLLQQNEPQAVEETALDNAGSGDRDAQPSSIRVQPPVVRASYP